MSNFTRFRPSPPKESAPEGRPPSRRRRVAAWATTILAFLFVLFALAGPNDLAHLTPAAFVRIPLEGLLGVGLVLVLPHRMRTAAATAIGVLLGLLTVLKVVDLGFSVALARQFDLVFDWPLLGAAVQFLSASIGGAGAVAAVVAAVLLVLAVLVGMTLAVRRLSRLVARHDTAAVRAAAVLGVAWVTCAALGVQLVPGVPVAGVATGRLLQIERSLRDHQAFAREEATDRFRDAPAGQLLTGLRGKDVLLAFVESYGHAAVADPRFAPGVDAVLDRGTAALRAAGFGSRSAFLGSPTAGGGSWLAHSTLLSGVWVNNQRRYQSLVSGDRFTLTKAFARGGWRTVAVMPGTTGAWPEAGFYGYQKVYDRWHIGYNGPRFNWGTPPDQFTLSAFQRAERSVPGHAPVMAEIPLVTSHAPWAPTPTGLVDWNKVGDGSVFDPMAARLLKSGDRPEDVWRSPGRIRTAYRDSIEYSLNSLISYVRTYGDKNLVLVFLGDHQPAPLVVGARADREVPITIVAKDPAVLDRISSWGWQDGLRPGRGAPVWPMSAFRDRFLTAFGPAAR